MGYKVTTEVKGAGKFTTKFASAKYVDIYIKGAKERAKLYKPKKGSTTLTIKKIGGKGKGVKIKW